MNLAKRAISLWPKYAIRISMDIGAAFVLACDAVLARVDAWEGDRAKDEQQHSGCRSTRVNS